MERLKICELFAEILHLQYLYTSSPLFDRMVQVSMFDDTKNSMGINSLGITTTAATTTTATTTDEGGLEDEGGEGGLDDGLDEGGSGGEKEKNGGDDKVDNVADELIYVTGCFVESKVLPMCLV